MILTLRINVLPPAIEATAAQHLKEAQNHDDH